jgi:hypothetical protein
MKNNFLNKCIFYSIHGSNLLTDLRNLYNESLCHLDINDSFDIESIDDTKINIVVLTWSRYFSEYYDDPIDKDETTKQGFIFTKKFFEIIKKISSKKLYFIIDTVMEAETFITPELVFFLEKFKQIGIKEDKIFWVDNNSFNLTGNFTSIRDFKINTLHFPHFFVSTLFQLPEPVNKTFEKEKDFLILNRRFGLSKFKLLKKISDRGLLDKSIYTILSIMADVEDVNTFDITELPNDVAKIDDILKDDSYLYKLNTDVFFKTKVNIVTETILEYKNVVDRFDDIIHITEKTWKPIYMGVPFVVSASNNHIETLHKFGFKTFDSVVNEDYDIEEDIDIKLNKVIDTAIDLVKKYNSKEILDIIEYNSNLFKNIEHKRKIVETFFLKPLRGLIEGDVKLL